jgi:DnaJ-class molecular chaperone
MDHYTTLGVSRTATQEEIKSAFRKLAMQHHPDRGGDINKFQEISNAYEILSDTDKRLRYDSPQSRQQHNPFGSGGEEFSVYGNAFDLENLFGQIFGNRPNPFAQQQQVMRTRLGVSLVDAYTGTESVIQLSTPQGVKVINIKIPPGVDNGDTMRYDNIINNVTLIVEFAITPDHRYERKGSDLYSQLTISVLDLIVGAKVPIQTINGKTIEVVIKPNTQPAQHIRVPGYGMPSRDGTMGDQILLIKPYIPDNIDNDIIDSINRSKNK